jgi:quercetin dioxygenase-like cupin family protein
MAIPHAAPGELIDVRPLAERMSSAVTSTLVKTDRLEVIRLVMPAGKTIPPHRARGEITVQCLEGRIVFEALGQSHEMEAGQMLFLSAGDEHALTAREDATVLVTILL